MTMTGANPLVVPPEWAPHRAMWIGWPSHPDLWLDNLEPARQEVAALVRSLAETGQERVNLLVRGAEAERAAHAAMPELANLRIIPGEFGDIWLRDTGPIYLSAKKAAAFRFNGWGGKYELPGDETVAGQIGAYDGADLERHDVILEGGALEHDGEGTIITTRQCLLNPNRNPGWTEAQAEAALARSLGAKKVLWLDDGLKNDHTDGHVDNLARFVAPGEVVCPMAWGQEDQNADVYDAAARALAGMTDAAGRKLTVHRIPSPGLVQDADGYVVPASHMNFIIGNNIVVVPVYQERPGLLATEALQMFIPDRLVVGVRAPALLSGGGSFHCISQQVPL